MSVNLKECKGEIGDCADGAFDKTEGVMRSYDPIGGMSSKPGKLGNYILRSDMESVVSENAKLRIDYKLLDEMCDENARHVTELIQEVNRLEKELSKSNKPRHKEAT